MLNRFKLFNLRDRVGTDAKDDGSSMIHDTPPSTKRQLPAAHLSTTQRGNGRQIPLYSAGTPDVHQMPQPTQSGSNGRCSSAATASPGRPQHQRAPPPPERRSSPGLQESRRGRTLPDGPPPSDHCAAEVGSTNSFGFGQSRNASAHQRAIQSRFNQVERNAPRTNQREIFIDQPPRDDVGCAAYDGSRSSSSSVAIRTPSSTSINSIASSSTTGGSGAVASARRSGLARRVSSSAQPDKRNGRNAAAVTTASTSSAKSAKPSSSSSIPAPSVSGSVSRAGAPKQTSTTTSGDMSTAATRRQRGGSALATNRYENVSSTMTAESTPAEHGVKPAPRGLIPRRNSARTVQLVDKGEVDVASPSTGRKLPQVVNSRQSATTGTDVSTPTCDPVPANRQLTSETAMNCMSTTPLQSVSTVPHASTRLPSSASSLPTSQRLSATSNSRDVEDRRQTAAHQHRQTSTPVIGASLTAPPSPAIGGQAPIQRSASVGRPTKEKSNSSISSGFGDESNNSTSDSTDSVIFQPPPSVTPSAAVNAAPTNNALCESSSSAIDSDSPPSEATASEDAKTDCAAAASAPPAHQTVDHITSLRGSRRQSLDESKQVAPVAHAVSSPADQSDAVTPPSHDNIANSETSPRTTELIDAFDCIKPMQPLIRSSIPCCVYEPSTRRLPTLLSQSSPSRRLVFSRPPIGPQGVVSAGGGRGGLSGRAGLSRESMVAACGYMSDGDVIRSGGCGSASVSRASDRLMSGYISEGGGGGGGVTSYARRMQQRFLEGILAVRQSMERNPQFTDDDRLRIIIMFC